MEIRKLSTSVIFSLAAILVVIVVATLVPQFIVHAGDGVYIPTSSETGLSDGGGGFSSVAVILLTVVNWIVTVIAVLAILMIVVAGIMYMVSAGDESQATSAKRALTYAVIGLIVALLAYVIVNAIEITFGVG